MKESTGSSLLHLFYFFNYVPLLCSIWQEFFQKAIFWGELLRKTHVTQKNVVISFSPFLVLLTVGNEAIKRNGSVEESPT